MNNHHLALSLLGLLATSSIPLRAQNAAPKVNVPVTAAPVDEDADMEAAANAGVKFAERFEKMTPAQRKVEMDKMLADMAKSKELITRRTLEGAGFKTPEIQNAVVEFLHEQERNRRAVRVAANKLYLALGSTRTMPARGAVMNDGEMLVLMSAFEDAAQAVRLRREADILALDKRIDFSTNPRLEAVLVLNGYIGEAAFFTGDAEMLGSSVIGSLATVDETFVDETPVDETPVDETPKP